MEKAPRKDNEDERLKSLRDLNILDTPPDEKLDIIAKIATKLLNVPISTISLVDADREWYKSAVGLTKKEESRDNSLSSHALYSEEPFVVPDTTKDPRFSDNPLVIGEEGIRSFAAVPILSKINKMPIGTFCVEGKEPKNFTPEDIAIIKGLAHWAEKEINNGNTIGLENRQSVHQIQDSEMRDRFFSSVLENSQDAIYTKDFNGIITSWNPASEKVFGYSAQEIIGKSVRLLVPEHHDDIDQILEKVRSGQKIDNYETVRRRKDGELIHVALSISPILEGNSKPVGIAVIARDVSRTFNTYRSPDYFSYIMTNMLDGIIATGVDGTINFWNKGSEAIYEIPSQEAQGKNLFETFEEWKQEMQDKVKAASENHSIPDFEKEHIQKNGNKVNLLISISPVFNRDNKIIGIVILSRDITKIKKVNQELIDRQKELDRVNKIMVDRELKMIELKKEIERLTQQNP